MWQLNKVWYVIRAKRARAPGQLDCNYPRRPLVFACLHLKNFDYRFGGDAACANVTIHCNFPLPTQVIEYFGFASCLSSWSVAPFWHHGGTPISVRELFVVRERLTRTGTVAVQARMVRRENILCMWFGP